MKTILYTIGSEQVSVGHGDTARYIAVKPLGAYGEKGMPPLFLSALQATRYLNEHKLTGCVVVPLSVEGTEAGTGMIAIERLRQMATEGYDSTHDDGHQKAELTSAAAAYCMAACNQIVYPDESLPSSEPPMWPFAQAYWKPHRDPVRNLVKAGALIAAEIDRVLRARNSSQPSAT